MGMGATCAYRGSRTTASAYLEDAPSNLTIVLNSHIAKVLMEGKKAVGVETIEGKQYLASKDVVLSGGVSEPPFA